MNNKLLSVVLISGIAVSGFASYSSADDATKTAINNTFKSQKVELTPEQEILKDEAKILIQKKKAGDELSDSEQTRLEEIKAELPERQGGKNKKSGKKGMKNLSDEEKTALESMNDDEKKEFFTAKKSEKTAQKEAAKGVIEKLINGESLTADEEAIKAQISEKINNSGDSKRSSGRANADTIKKLINGETITADEKASLEEMKAKHEERAAQKEAIAPIIEKKKAGEVLSEAEQTQLDEARENFKGKKGGKRGGDHGGKKSEKKGDRNGERSERGGDRNNTSQR